MLFYPHFNYFAQKNSQAVIQAVEKLKNRNLPIEQILDEEELLNDMKFASSSQLIN
jgi:hypothetical protein